MKLITELSIEIIWIVVIKINYTIPKNFPTQCVFKKIYLEITTFKSFKNVYVFMFSINNNIHILLICSFLQ